MHHNRDKWSAIRSGGGLEWFQGRYTHFRGTSGSLLLGVASLECCGMGYINLGTAVVPASRHDDRDIASTGHLKVPVAMGVYWYRCCINFSLSSAITENEVPCCLLLTYNCSTGRHKYRRPQFASSESRHSVTAPIRSSFCNMRNLNASLLFGFDTISSPLPLAPLGDKGYCEQIHPFSLQDLPVVRAGEASFRRGSQFMLLLSMLQMDCERTSRGQLIAAMSSQHRCCELR